MDTSPRGPESASKITLTKQRAIMVEKQLKARGIKDPRVLAAMGNIPREAFIQRNLWQYAYDDGPLPIGEGQTISQPYIVALMTEILEVKPTDKVLEIGTGSGYQSAVLSELADKVYTIEIVESLQKKAKKVLDGLGKKNIFYLVGDGFQGWKEYAPFDKIILTAAPPTVPQPLVDQLKQGGRLVAPVGQYSQYLKVMEKHVDGQLKEVTSVPVRFVPMVGEAQKSR